MRSSGLAVALVLVVAAVVTARVTQVRKCANDVNQDACSITELQIDPCTKKKEACKLKKGANATIEFKFTPNFAATELTTAVYWPGGASGEVMFDQIGMVDACPHTTCPLVPGTENSFSYKFYLAKKLPFGTYVLRWKVWNTQNQAEQCCLETTIYLY